MNPPCPTFGQKRAHMPFVHGRAVPNHQQFLRYMRQQVLEEEHGVFCISPRNSTFQQCTSRVDGSVFLSVSDVSEFVRPSEHRIMEHEMRPGNPRVSEGRPFDTR